MPFSLDADALVTLIAFAGIGGPILTAALLTLYIARTTMLEGKGRQ